MDLNHIIGHLYVLLNMSDKLHRFSRAIGWTMAPRPSRNEAPAIPPADKAAPPPAANPVMAGSPHLPARPARPVRVWGIDLGTTNSAIAEISCAPGGAPPAARCIEIGQETGEGTVGLPLVPSVLALLPSGRPLVGEGARRLRAKGQGALTAAGNLFYDTKNEMGLRRVYRGAPPEYDRPYKVAGEILDFILLRAEAQTGDSAGRVVVTVPASFQLNQRRDTLLAAELASLELGEYDLLDEPTAALLQYLMTGSQNGIFSALNTATCLVFDFGGGTCDVALLKCEIDRAERQVRASTITASRYHRLGGGDIDAAIVHEHLIPKLLAENGLASLDLSWTEKKKCLEPQLLDAAERLKVTLCQEVVKRWGPAGCPFYDDSTAFTVRTEPLVCVLGERCLTLAEPALSLAEFNELLVPFLDTDHLYARETEYRLTQSVFAPIQDALDRVRLRPRAVDAVLLTGGSTLIPQVRRAVERYFGSARICTFDDPLDAQLAVSRGAAWHAFFLETTGRPFLQPVVNDGISLLTGRGEPYELVRAGTPIPFPKDGSFAVINNLAMPAGLVREVAMEVVAGPDRRKVFSETWRLAHLAEPGEPITLQYRIGANQEFECRAFLTNQPTDVFERTVANPLFNATQPEPERMRIEVLEEKLSDPDLTASDSRKEMVELADLYANIRQHERALDWIRTALRRAGRPDPWLLNREGMIYGDLGDLKREERAYREADKGCKTWGVPMFNLSLSLLHKGRYEEAIAAIDAAIGRDPAVGPYYVHKARCLEKAGKGGPIFETLALAKRHFSPVERMDDWELGWADTYAKMVNDAELIGKILARRERKLNVVAVSNVHRPVVTGAVQRV